MENFNTESEETMSRSWAPLNETSMRRKRARSIEPGEIVDESEDGSPRSSPEARWNMHHWSSGGSPYHDTRQSDEWFSLPDGSDTTKRGRHSSRDDHEVPHRQSRKSDDRRATCRDDEKYNDRRYERNDSRRVNTYRKSSGVCFQFLDGRCRRGSSCKFRHQDADPENNYSGRGTNHDNYRNRTPDRYRTDDASYRNEKRMEDDKEKSWDGPSWADVPTNKNLSGTSADICGWTNWSEAKTDDKQDCDVNNDNSISKWGQLASTQTHEPNPCTWISDDRKKVVGAETGNTSCNGWGDKTDKDASKHGWGSNDHNVQTKNTTSWSGPKSVDLTANTNFSETSAEKCGRPKWAGVKNDYKQDGDDKVDNSISKWDQLASSQSHEPNPSNWNDSSWGDKNGNNAGKYAWGSSDKNMQTKNTASWSGPDRRDEPDAKTRGNSSSWGDWGQAASKHDHRVDTGNTSWNEGSWDDRRTKKAPRCTWSNNVRTQNTTSQWTSAADKRKASSPPRNRWGREGSFPERRKEGRTSGNDSGWADSRKGNDAPKWEGTVTNVDAPKSFEKNSVDANMDPDVNTGYIPSCSGPNRADATTNGDMPSSSSQWTSAGDKRDQAASWGKWDQAASEQDCRIEADKRSWNDSNWGNKSREGTVKYDTRPYDVGNETGKQSLWNGPDRRATGTTKPYKRDSDVTTGDFNYSSRNSPDTGARENTWPVADKGKTSWKLSSSGGNVLTQNNIVGDAVINVQGERSCNASGWGNDNNVGAHNHSSRNDREKGLMITTKPVEDKLDSYVRRRDVLSWDSQILDKAAKDREATKYPSTDCRLSSAAGEQDRIVEMSKIPMNGTSMSIKDEPTDDAIMEITAETFYVSTWKRPNRNKKSENEISVASSQNGVNHATNGKKDAPAYTLEDKNQDFSTQENAGTSVEKFYLDLRVEVHDNKISKVDAIRKTVLPPIDAGRMEDVFTSVPLHKKTTEPEPFVQHGLNLEKQWPQVLGNVRQIHQSWKLEQQKRQVLQKCKGIQPNSRYSDVDNEADTIRGDTKKFTDEEGANMLRFAILQLARSILNSDVGEGNLTQKAVDLIVDKVVSKAMAKLTYHDIPHSWENVDDYVSTNIVKLSKLVHDYLEIYRRMNRCL